MELKRCTKCGENKPNTNEYFAFSNKSKGILRPSCKVCDKKHREKNKDKISEKGKQLCMEDEEFYREILEIFLDSPTAMELKQYYEESDFENYRIKIHAMKSNLANIGATTVSDMAKKLEYALKYDNDVSYVQENHDKFMKEYGRVVSEVKTYMERK